MPVKDDVAALVIEKVRRLRPEQQEEVLRFVESLEHGQAEAGLRRSVKGLWADLDIDLTEEDLATARKELWGAFPRSLDEFAGAEERL